MDGTPCAEGDGTCSDGARSDCEPARKCARGSRSSPVGRTACSTLPRARARHRIATTATRNMSRASTRRSAPPTLPTPASHPPAQPDSAPSTTSPTGSCAWWTATPETATPAHARCASMRRGDARRVGTALRSSAWAGNGSTRRRVGEPLPFALGERATRRFGSQHNRGDGIRRSEQVEPLRAPAGRSLDGIVRGWRTDRVETWVCPTFWSRLQHERQLLPRAPRRSANGERKQLRVSRQGRPPPREFGQALLFLLRAQVELGQRREHDRSLEHVGGTGANCR